MCSVAFGPINDKSYLLTNMMENTFMSNTGANGDISLSSLNNMDDFWKVSELVQPTFILIMSTLHSIG